LRQQFQNGLAWPAISGSSRVTFSSWATWARAIRAHPSAVAAGAGAGETAIVYDPAVEYTPQFFGPDRGDAILNPLDRRTPFWTPADELRLDAEALD